MRCFLVTVLFLSSFISFSQTNDQKIDSVFQLIVNEKYPTIIQSSSSRQPLFFVNGKEIKQEEVNKIDSKNIESIQVLKNKDATDKYGARGENGVILIKLKTANLKRN
jgi:TonB-dependent SusC/RagA subfamily outer membrane receptor